MDVLVLVKRVGAEGQGLLTICRGMNYQVDSRRSFPRLVCSCFPVRLFLRFVLALFFGGGSTLSDFCAWPYEPFLHLYSSMPYVKPKFASPQYHRVMLMIRHFLSFVYFTTRIKIEVNRLLSTYIGPHHHIVLTVFSLPCFISLS